LDYLQNIFYYTIVKKQLQAFYIKISHLNKIVHYFLFKNNKRKKMASLFFFVLEENAFFILFFSLFPIDKKQNIYYYSI